MTRTAKTAFLLLAVATVGGLYVAQHLRRSDPVVLGVRRTAAFSPKGTGPTAATVSFFLKRRDTVAVTVVDGQGDEVRTLSIGRSVPAKTRVDFVWDGRTANGKVPLDGTYRFRIGLARQGRSLTIPSGVRLDTKPATPIVTAVDPVHGNGPLILPGAAQAVGRVGGTPGYDVEGFVLRTDVVPARIVKRFPLGDRPAQIRWDGTVGGHPAADGTYLLGISETDSAGNRGSAPVVLTPVPGPPRGHPGVTIRHLGVAPPTGPVRPGGLLGVQVDARGHGFQWGLKSAAGGALLAHGKGRGTVLRLRVPNKARGLLTLAVVGNGRRVEVPVAVTNGGHGLLVVLPAIRWQAVAPVDGNGDGLPDLLTMGRPVGLARVLPRLHGGLAGLNSEVKPLLAILRAERIPFDLTTDIAVAANRGPRLEAHTGVVFAGEETWLPASTLQRIRSSVMKGTNVLDLGLNSLRQTIEIRAGVASKPSLPSSADVLGGIRTPASKEATDLLVWKDTLGLFSTTGGSIFAGIGWTGTASVKAPGKLASAAGPQSGIAGIAAWRLGRGVVIRPGVPSGAEVAQSSPTMLALISKALSITAAR